MNDSGRTESGAERGAPTKAGGGLASNLSQLGKMRITFLVAVTAFVGHEMGRSSQTLLEATAGGASPWRLGATPSGYWVNLAATLAGVCLSCMGASALNQFGERDLDAKMPRTRNRPLPAGRMTPSAAMKFGVIWSLLGVGLLWVLVNPMAAWLAAFTIGSYVWVYTPLKRVTSLSTVVGAVPGAMPPVIGFAGATGWVGAEAWAMFAIMFLWQLPHSLAIAWLYRDDYAKAGLPLLPVVDREGTITSRQIVLECLALGPVSLAPAILGMAGSVYFVTALSASLVFLLFGLSLALTRTREQARLMFFASLVYLPLVLGVLLYDRL